jgi:CRP-like cAMP-binding protein
MSADEVAPFSENRILSVLPDLDRQRLLPHLEPVRTELKQILYAPNEAVSHIYFPLNGVVSLMTIMADGSAIEVATVGNEGMIGLPVFLGAGSMPGQALSQIPGDALRMAAEVFRTEAQSGGALQQVLQRYTQGLLNQTAQSAACNRLHAITERCARWLLMTHDRVGTDQFPLTHEFLSQMLGVRRATVTVAVGALQQAGLIRSHRGHITVLDRVGLEAASCECYRIIREEYDRLLGEGA